MMAQPTNDLPKGNKAAYNADAPVTAGAVMMKTPQANIFTSILDKEPIRAFCMYCRGKGRLGGGKAGRGKCERCKGKGHTIVGRRLR